MTIDQLQALVFQLRDEIVELKKYNAQLKKENAQLKNENAQLKMAEMAQLRSGLKLLGERVVAVETRMRQVRATMAKAALVEKWTVGWVSNSLLSLIFRE